MTEKSKMKANPPVAPVEIEPGVFVVPGTGNGALPSVHPRLSVELMERTVGPHQFTDDGSLKYSVIREVLSPPGRNSILHG